MLVPREYCLKMFREKCRHQDPEIIARLLATVPYLTVLGELCASAMGGMPQSAKRQVLAKAGVFCYHAIRCFRLHDNLFIV